MIELTIIRRDLIEAMEILEREIEYFKGLKEDFSGLIEIRLNDIEKCKKCIKILE
jgi:hypothetical protein